MRYARPHRGGGAGVPAGRAARASRGAAFRTATSQGASADRSYRPLGDAGLVPGRLAAQRVGLAWPQEVDVRAHRLRPARAFGVELTGALRGPGHLEEHLASLGKLRDRIAVLLDLL